MYTKKIVLYGKGFRLDSMNRVAPISKRSFWRRLLALALAGMVAGCALTEDYKAPPVVVEKAWRVNFQDAADLANTTWWEAFQDPVLNDLIKTALNANQDLEIATARVEEATAAVKTVQSEFWPQAGYGGSAGRRRESEERRFPFGNAVDRTNSQYSGFLAASWELDIWGRIRRSNEAAKADLLATEEARQAVILTLVSSVASSYLELLRLDKQLQIANDTAAFRKKWLELFEKRRKGGQISKLELIQVRSEYEQTLTQIPSIEMQIAMQENALSVLLGRNPGPIKRGKTLDTVGIPDVPQGIPSEVLARRPDIRQSEQDLIAANARIGVARTLYFPSISLTGLFGYASSDIDNLLQDSANIWEYTGEFLGPIFTGGRIKSEIRQAEARYAQLLHAYLRTIQNAFKEVNDALVSRQKLDELLQEESKLVGTLSEYAGFSRKSYDAGFASYLAVLDADRKLFTRQIRYARTQSNLLQSMVSIYKAMGGGWVVEAAKQIELSE
jgi:multidrug efflux system outer membrane protein